jgi:RNA polymerase primary sigma factor
VYGIEQRTRLEEYDSKSITIQGTNSVDILDIQLTEEEIINDLRLPGGRKELTQILLDGAMAKDTMVKSNIRLVQSIVKKFFQQGGKSFGGGTDAVQVAKMYGGSWNTPSMEEAVQEGIIGLALAADRFEPERNFKFSTYATFYITDRVRKCFQDAETGCLYIPHNYFLVRNRYRKLVNEHYGKTGKPLDMATAAQKLGMKQARLEYIILRASPLVQLDAPGIGDYGGFANGAGKAGSPMDMTSGATPTLGDALESDDPSAEDLVERSLLRQCLENALAAELSADERDVLRLRHGLDDGLPRTPKEVSESCGGLLTITDVRRVEYRAYDKLRDPTSIHNQRLIGFALTSFGSISIDA